MSNPQMTLNEKTMSMKQEAVPLGFKQTEVGIIPKDWMVINIAKTMKLINGYGFKPSQWEKEGLPIIRIQNLNDSHAPYNYFTGVIDTKFHIKKGDLLFAWSGSKGVSFGARVWQGKKAILNQHIFKVIPDENFVTASYSYYVLRKVQEQIEKMAHGFKSSFVHVKKGDLENTPLPIPPKNEQTAIANVLSDTDTLITELEHLITKKHSIKTATMQQLLTGHTRLPQFSKYPDGTFKGYKPSDFGLIPEDWNIVCIQEVGVVDPENLSVNTQKNYEFNYISLESIEAGSLLETTKHTFSTAPSRARRVLRFNDLLVSTVRPNLMSHYFIANEIQNFIGSTGFSVIRCKQQKFCAAYLYQHLFHSVINKQIDMLITGSNYPAINSTDVKNLKFPAGSLEEQTAIATILSDMDTELEVLEQKLAKFRDIKQGMMQQLLTGRIRLPLEQQP
ncbi:MULTISPECIES: restriction endonuclease subunit S [unclassified Serratia (in: enterobacteria)]|uniref:restriction endonuclease subunit S n=1 Tax=unclassified Serratia (in: enterobacteria) TaxID=2647522 RepID=UPI0004A7BF8C|nr:MULTISPECIES: restriction endonuclease subunit S [unclassified Serratia (in: enterobacteria)]